MSRFRDTHPVSVNADNNDDDDDDDDDGIQ